MKLLIAIFLISFSVSAQNNELENELQVAPIVIEKISFDKVDAINISLELKKVNTIALKKSYKNIIEKTLSGEKYLIFKAKREVKTC